jgi:hypothetical protein
VTARQKGVARDRKTFQAFVEKLTAAAHVRNVKTSLTLRSLTQSL